MAGCPMFSVPLLDTFADKDSTCIIAAGVYGNLTEWMMTSIKWIGKSMGSEETLCFST